MKKYHLGFTDEMILLLKGCVNKRLESISGHFFRQNDTICRRMLKRDSKLLSYSSLALNFEDKLLILKDFEHTWNDIENRTLFGEPIVNTFQLQMASSDTEVREDIYDSSFPMTSRAFGKTVKSVQIITDIFRFKELNREISMDVALIFNFDTGLIAFHKVGYDSLGYIYVSDTIEDESAVSLEENVAEMNFISSELCDGERVVKTFTE